MGIQFGLPDKVILLLCPERTGESRFLVRRTEVRKKKSDVVDVLWHDGPMLYQRRIAQYAKKTRRSCNITWG